MKLISFGLITSFALLASAGRMAPADVFLLTNGGRLVGELTNPDQSPRRQYVIETSTGARVTLLPSQVRQVSPARPVMLQYEKIRPGFPDTVDGQWALAQWCRKHRLTTQRKTHLQRVIELDPDHADARQLLGYSQIGGKWLTQDDVMQRRGYRRYKGAWKLPQQIELLERAREVELAQKQWYPKLKRWISWLGGSKVDEGLRNIRAIDDPSAVKALAGELARNRFPQTRVLLIEVLARIGTDDAIRELALCSIEDPVEEVRLTCLDYLQKEERPDVVAYYVGKLRSKNNHELNCAAVGLGRMKDPSAIGPLIDALVTYHKHKIQRGNPGSVSGTFGTGPGGSGAPGGSGLSTGGGPRILNVPYTNQAVLDALISITRHNFSFEQQAWRVWYASQQKHETFDVRHN